MLQVPMLKGYLSICELIHVQGSARAGYAKDSGGELLWPLLWSAAPAA